MRRVILINWYKTWCSHFLWDSLKKTDSTLFHQIRTVLFEQNPELALDWMRGYTRFCNIWHFFEDKFIPKNVVQTAFMQDLAAHRPDLPEFIPAVQRLREKGYRVIVIADYFDVFGGYIYPYHHLEKVFDGYLSSSEIGCLKADTLSDGTRPFFKKFMADNALNPQDCILIDNDLISDSFYREQGFEVYSPQKPNDVLQTLLKL